MTEERRYALLDTAAGRKELRGMLKEIMDASPDPHLPKERSRAGNALLDRMGADLIELDHPRDHGVQVLVHQCLRGAAR